MQMVIRNTQVMKLCERPEYVGNIKMVLKGATREGVDR